MQVESNLAQFGPQRRTFTIRKVDSNMFYWAVIYLHLESRVNQLSTKSVQPPKFPGLQDSKADLQTSPKQKEQHSDVLEENIVFATHS